MPATNEDFWRWAADLSAGRDSRVVKIESHMAPESAMGAVDIRFWLGNLMADAVAAEFATAAAVPRAVVTALSRQQEIAAMVALRATAILRRCMEVDPLRRRRPRARKLRAARIDALVSETSHDLAAQDGSRSPTLCSVCGERPSRRGLARWLSSPCAGRASVAASAEPLVGASRLHASRSFF